MVIILGNEISYETTYKPVLLIWPFVRSSNECGPCEFFSYPTVWAFHRLYKKKPTNNKLRVEERKDKHGFRAAKHKKVKFGTF